MRSVCVGVCDGEECVCVGECVCVTVRSVCVWGGVMRSVCVGVCDGEECVWVSVCV